jgi:hypothetical protein
MNDILRLNHNICFCQIDKYLGRLFGLITASIYHAVALPLFDTVCLLAVRLTVPHCLSLTRESKRFGPFEGLKWICLSCENRRLPNQRFGVLSGTCRPCRIAKVRGIRVICIEANQCDRH